MILICRTIEQFQSGKFTLTGQWDGPAQVDSGNKVPFPAVIFTHGFTGNRLESRRMYARLSARLASIGILTFRFDHRGCGESEGDFLDFNARGLLEDLDSALAVFVSNPNVDLTRTAVVGYSLGGLSASYLTHKRPDWLTAVLWAPVARPDIIRDRLATYPDFPNYPQRGYFDYGGYRVSTEYFDHIGKLNSLEWIKNYTAEILIIQGDEDPIVKPEQADLYLIARKNSDDKIVSIKKGDHGFGSADNIDFVLKTSEDWLAQKLLT